MTSNDYKNLDGPKNLPTVAINIEFIINMYDVSEILNPNLEDYEDDLLIVLLRSRN